MNLAIPKTQPVHKVCTRCGVAQPQVEFYRDKRSRDQLTSWCKSCTRADVASRYKPKPKRKRAEPTHDERLSSLKRRFDAKVLPEPNTGCWLWAGSVQGQASAYQYGTIRGLLGTTDRAHRVSYELHRGPIPDGMYVCHACDVPLCVNPDHLFLGSQKDNMQDARAKGRLPSQVKAFCKRGHPMFGDNLLVRPYGRRCRACSRIRNKHWQDRHASD